MSDKGAFCSLPGPIFRVVVNVVTLAAGAAEMVTAAAATALLASTQPVQLHLALADSGMRVMWATAARTTTSMVQYGTSATSLDHNETGAVRQYLKDHTYHHTVALSLEPGTTYHYRVGDGVSSWSEPRTFTTAAAHSDEVALSVFGDLGFLNSTVRPMLIPLQGLFREWSATYTRNTVAQLVASGSVQGVWHLGDIGYADDSYAHLSSTLRFGYEDAYDGFMEWIEPIASAVPYMVSPGNHESECHSPACLAELGKYGRPLSNFSAYNTRWAMPFAESGGTSNMWYSFDLGPVHFVSLDTETDWEGAEEEGTGDSHIPWLHAGSFGAKGEYLRWLEADLKRADQQRNSSGRPWIVAGGHRPFGDIEQSHGALFAKYGVDAYFAGHTHSYARDTQVFAGAGGRSAEMLSVVVGGAGCDEMKADDSPRATSRGGDLPSYSTHRYASGVLRVNRTVLQWQLLDSKDGSVLDEAIRSK